MSRVRVRLLSAIGASLVLVIGSIMTSDRAVGQPAGPSVTIAGPLPLPVTGSLDLSNTSADPLFVRSVPKRYPWQAVGTLQNSVVVAELLTVPSNQRLIIEYVSTRGVGPSGSPLKVRLDAISTTVGGTSTAFYFVSPQISIGSPYYSTQQPTKIYADPGTKVHIFVEAHAAADDSVYIAVSGYLEDIIP